MLASEEVRSRAGESYAWTDEGEMPVRGRAGSVQRWELALGPALSKE